MPYQALLAIKGRTRMTVGDLSRELLVAQHSGSELVDRLVGNGLLTRTPDVQDRSVCRSPSPQLLRLFSREWRGLI